MESVEEAGIWSDACCQIQVWERYVRLI